PPSATEPQGAPTRRADEVLPSSRIVTEIGPAPAVRRPAMVIVTCVMLGLLAACFFLHFVGAGVYGAAAAAIGVILAAMAILRIWAGYWDGMIPAILFCLCVAGGAFLPSQFPAARAAFLAGAGLAFVLLSLTWLLRSGRDFFSG
ncbi:unnamed protein product, partial [marine sediment metagenome]